MRKLFQIKLRFNLVAAQQISLNFQQRSLVFYNFIQMPLICNGKQSKRLPSKKDRAAKASQVKYGTKPTHEMSSLTSCECLHLKQKKIHR